MASDADLATLRSHFEEHSGDKYKAGWSKLWEDNFMPWDRLKPNPALAETLEQGEDVIGKAAIEVDGQLQRKKALVPGCGRGVDILVLESFGYDAVGLDVSPKALEEANKYCKEHEDEYQPRDKSLGRGTRRFVSGDFFSDDWFEQAGTSGKFDLIYDYTVSGLHFLLHRVY